MVSCRSRAIPSIHRPFLCERALAGLFDAIVVVNASHEGDRIRTSEPTFYAARAIQGEWE